MNKLKNIIHRLEGYSYDNLAFEVVKYSVFNDTDVIVKAKAYCKDGADVSAFKIKELAEITARLTDNCFSGEVFSVIRADRVGDTWELCIEEVKSDVQNN